MSGYKFKPNKDESIGIEIDESLKLKKGGVKKLKMKFNWKQRIKIFLTGEL